MSTGTHRGLRALVTGGRGFLARHLAEALAAEGAEVVLAVRRPWEGAVPGGARVVQVDLRDRAAAEAAFRGMDRIYHLAAVGWGFHENLRRQPELLTENLLLNTAVLDAAHRAGVGRYLFTSSAAVYPAHLDVQEEDAPWDQPPHPGEFCYGWAKRVGEIQARAYHRHHGLPVAIVRPSNPYGPHDALDPAKAHVIPSLVARALAGEAPFTVMGSGRASRSFVHARDVARGMVRALEVAADAEPINLASPATTSIAELVTLVLSACGRAGAEVRFDTTKPDGQLRRVPSVARAAERLGLKDYVPLEEGLRETVAWVRAQGAAR